MPIVVLILIMFIPMAKADINVNLVLKNNCPYSVKFTWGNSDSMVVSEFKRLRTNSTFSFRQSGDTHGFIKYYDQKDIENGALVFRTVRKILQENTFEVTAKRGSISIDQKEMAWHRWYGTPSFTVTSCPSTIDIQHSQIFSGITRILIFGDSLSDTGSLHKKTWGVIPKSLPYYNGAFSNGEVWSTLLRSELGGRIPISNYAVGGATAHSSLSSLIRYTLGDEVDNFHKESAHKKWKDQKNYLAFIFIGANDYINKEHMLVPARKEYVGKIISDINNAAKSLLNKGVKKITFVGLPDLGLTPRCSQDHKSAELVGDLSRMHNTRLLDLVSSYKDRYPGTGYEFTYVGIMDVINQVVHGTEQFNRKYRLHITNVADSCWKGGYYGYKKRSMGIENQDDSILKKLPDTADIQAAFQMSANTGKLCSDPDSYMFWDRVHPTARVHGVIYKIIKNNLGVKTVQQLAP